MKSVTNTERMRQWDPSWEAKHFPMWLSKRCRAHLRGRGLYRPGKNSADYVIEVFCLPEFQGILDHYGSRKRPHHRSFITQPYGDFTSAALGLCAALNLKLASPAVKPAPYDEMAYLFEFEPLGDL